MAEFLKAFKAEITKVARKELKNLTGDMKKDIVKLKKTVATLRKEVNDLSRQKRQIEREVVRNSELRQQEEEKQLKVNVDKIRVTGTMIRKLRTKLKLSQADMGVLLGVTGQSIYQWERRENESLKRIRNAAKIELAKLRKMTRGEVKTLLEQFQTEE
ncbi:MAG TPA: helix-turn-helix domain-containing protein [Phycisphaerae bacterium]|nr:helix-turn-helix domain-containing protein [Phycisphaerae bacterium]